MGFKRRGFYALLLAITVFCSSTLAFATDNHLLSKGKDQRTTILAGPDTHDVAAVTIFSLYVVSADIPEICPEDFKASRYGDPRQTFKDEYLKQERTSQGNFIHTLFILPEQYRSTKRQFTRKKKYAYNTRSKIGKEILITTYTDFALIPPLINENIPANASDVAISDALEDPHLQNIRSTI